MGEDIFLIRWEVEGYVGKVWGRVESIGPRWAGSMYVFWGWVGWGNTCHCLSTSPLYLLEP